VIGVVVFVLLALVALACAQERRPCHPGWERSPSSRLCVPDCKPTCAKTRIAEAQTRFYGPRGESLGTAIPDGSGGFTFRNAGGRVTGRSSTSGGETTFYGPGGNVTGRSSGPPPARPTFPGQGK
jgi:hypothetical protein